LLIKLFALLQLSFFSLLHISQCCQRPLSHCCNRFQLPLARTTWCWLVDKGRGAQRCSARFISVSTLKRRCVCTRTNCTLHMHTQHKQCATFFMRPLFFFHPPRPFPLFLSSSFFLSPHCCSVHPLPLSHSHTPLLTLSLLHNSFSLTHSLSLSSSIHPPPAVLFFFPPQTTHTPSTL